MPAYLFLVTLCWALFALLYGLLLRRETFFRANRVYLLSAVGLGLILPLVGRLPAGIATAVAAPLPAISVGLQPPGPAADGATAWLSLLFWVYLAGAGLAALRMAWGMGQLIGIALHGQTERLPDGCWLIRSGEARLPFSFFRWIFVPLDADPEADDFQRMLAHERAHASGSHSVDVLLLELLCVAFWFHPLAHWYRRSLRAVHEYLADGAAARQTGRRQYGLLLLRQTHCGGVLLYANHFFQSPLRQRLLMLTRSASAPVRKWKFGLALPLVWTLWSIAVQFPAEGAHRPEAQPSEAFGPAELDQAPSFPGGMAALVDFLTTQIRYPEEARRERAGGLVLVQFVVDKTGALHSIEPAPAPPNARPALQRADLEQEAIRVVQRMPPWAPGYKNGVPVACKMTLPIRFKLE